MQQANHTNHLYRDFERLVPATCRRYAGGVPAATYEDLEAVGRLALWQAAQEWRPDKGAAFPTFAIGRIRFALLHARRSDRWFTYAPRGLSPLSLDAPLVTGGGIESETVIGETLAASEPTGEKVVTDKAGRAELWKRVAALPPKQAVVLRLRYQQEWEFAQIGAHLGFSTQRAQQVHKIALATLRSGRDKGKVSAARPSGPHPFLLPKEGVS